MPLCFTYYNNSLPRSPRLGIYKSPNLLLTWGAGFRYVISMSDGDEIEQPEAPEEKPARDKLCWCYYAAAAVLAIMGLVYLNDFRSALVAQERWVRTSGWVTGAEVVTHYTRHSASYGTFVSYSYATAGGAASGGPVELNKFKFYFSEAGARADLLGKFPQGRSITVYYNPENSGQSSLGLGGAPGLAVPIVFFVLAFGAVYFVRAGQAMEPGQDEDDI